MAEQKKCTVSIWSAQPDCVASEQWPQLFALLDTAEQARVAQFRFAGDRRAYVLAHGLRRLAVAELLELPGASGARALRFAQTEAGRPLLCLPRNRRLFVSHAHTRAAVIVAACETQPLGIDIEALHSPPPDASLLRQFMVWSAWSGFDCDAPRGFYQAWTALEAFLKLTGCGLSGLQARAERVHCTSWQRWVGRQTWRLRWSRTREGIAGREAWVICPKAPAGCVAALALEHAVQHDTQHAALCKQGQDGLQLNEFSLHQDSRLWQRLC